MGAPSTGLPFFEEALELRRVELGDDDEEVLELRFEIARAHFVGGDRVVARELFRELDVDFTEAFEPSDRRRIFPADHLARLEHPGAAIPVHLRILDLQREQLARQAEGVEYEDPGSNLSIDIASTLNMLGTRHRDLGQRRLAADYFRQSLDLIVSLMHERSPPALIVGHHLAGVMEDPVESIAALEEILAVAVDVFPPESQRTAEFRLAIGASLRRAGRLEASLDALREAERELDASVAADHPKFEALRIETARTLRALGRPGEALAQIERAETGRQDDLGLGVLLTIRSRLLADLERADEALAAAEHAVEHLESTYEPAFAPDWRLVAARVARSRALLLGGDAPAAESEIEAVIAARADDADPPPWYPAEAQIVRGLALVELGDVAGGAEAIGTAWPSYAELPERDAELAEGARLVLDGGAAPERSP